MSSVSGLSPAHRARARAEILRVCGLMVANKNATIYTQGWRRWDGINHRKTASNLFPFYGDCSSTDTFLLWHALRYATGRGTRDLVNELRWLAGNTATMVRHGKPVIHLSNIEIGDQVFYGDGPGYEHVATVISPRRRLVFTHGSPAGPFISSVDYRLDRGPIRRYI